LPSETAVSGHFATACKNTHLQVLVDFELITKPGEDPHQALIQDTGHVIKFT
jgi:hypothetical protein